MYERSQSQAYHPDRDDRDKNLTWAGVFLVTVGVVHGIQGVIALVNEEYFTRRTDYLDLFTTTSWGWVHVVVGVLALLTGFGVLRRMGWSKPAAIVLASLSILVAFAWLPFQLVGSLIIMVADCLVIGAVVAPGVFERD